MNKKRDIFEKDLFRQAGEDLWRKVREVEQLDSKFALSSWQKVEERLKAPRKTFVLRIRYLASFVAAAGVLLLAIGCYFWMVGDDKSSVPLALLEEKSIDSLPDDEIVLVEIGCWVQLKNGATITHDNIGKPSVKDSQIKKKVLATKTGNLNQIIVPKGKRANIIFSDGTQIYVNADTRVIYPAVFAKDKREILVTGEAYLDVTPDSSRPFIVKTNAFNVKVLGTQFNVCVYGDEPKASVVIVEGRVEVENDKHVKEVLAPNQMIELGNKGVSIKEVDVFEYICWKDNLMQVNDRKVGDVLNKLARYYGRTIVFDKEIAEIPLSGKLDLRGSLEDVVEIICQSLFLRQETDKENNIIILK